MDYDALLSQVIDLLQREKRVPYRALKRRFDIDDDYIEDLKIDIIEAKQLAVDENDRILVWIGDTDAIEPTSGSTIPEPTSALATDQERAPSSYTPTYLAEKILTAKSGLEGERKVVTVLFADIKDSTELIRDLDPEDAQKLLDPAIHIMMEAVHRFEGTVNQVLGDGIMSLFGAPISHEDHAARACYSALSMQSVMRDYTEAVRRTRGLTLRIRVGLNSGEVVVRTIGNDLHMDYSAVGQTTNLASRMEQLADPGHIILTASTLRLVEGLVQVNDLGPIPIKGMDEPVDVYELTGASSVRRRLQASVSRGLTKFVGRDTEIEALHQALEQAGTGHGQIVSAVGEAGVGKSRLMYEFIHSHRTQGWLVLESASVSYGKATPYFPVIDLLKRYVHVEDGDDARTIRAKVTGQILTLDESLQDTIPALLSLLDALPEDSPFLKLDPPQRRQRTLDGLKRILLRESQVQPLLLVFEDLHWHDSESQALLDNLVESLPTAQLLLLVNYRPEYTHSWGSKTYYTQLRLDPLPPESADALLEALLGDDASLESLKKLLIERTEGNPFFLEESVRTLVETQVLAGESRAYRLAQDLPSIQVPPTVQAVLAARIDRLPQDEKSLLQTASVIGTEVPFTLLQAIAEIPEDALYRGLTHLQATEFLYETSLFPERMYTFKHALTQNVSYQSLLTSTRQQYHRQIAHALKEQFSEAIESQPELLALHLTQGEVWEQAFIYLARSGNKARQAYANEEAITFYTQALEVSERIAPPLDTTQFLPVYESRGLVWMLLTKYDDAIADFQRMRETARTSNNQKKEGESLCHLSFAHWLKFSEDQVPFIERYAHEALEIARQTGDQKILARGLISLGFVPQVRGDLDESDRQHEAALEISRHEGYHDTLASSLLWLSAHAYWRGDFSRARHLGQESLTTARDIHDGLVELLALAFLSTTSWSAGDYAHALLLVHEGQAKAQARDNLFIGGRMMNTLGWFYREFGALSQALEYDQESLESGRVSGVSNVETSALINVGLDYLALRQYDHALSYLKPTFERVEHEIFGTERWRWKVRLLLGLAELFYTTGAYDQALIYVEQGLKEAQATWSQKYTAQGWALRGKIVAKLGDVETAGTELQRAFTLADQLQSPSLIYPIAYDLGQWHESTGNEPDAAALYDRAKTTIERMATAVEDEALRSTFLQSLLVQEIHERATRLVG